MFENNQMRRTEELLREILLELRLLNSGMESLPERFRKTLLNKETPAPAPPTEPPQESSPTVEDVSLTEPQPAHASNLKNSLPEFDLDSFLKNNLNEKE